MKAILTFVLLSLFTITATAQIGISAKEWQEDLRFLQNTVHEQYAFLFKKTTAKEFDAAVEKLYNEIPSMEEHEVIIGLARIVALFEYGHTRLGYGSWFGQKPYRFTRMPYNLYQFSDGIYIQGCHKDYEKALGAKVLKIEGHDINKAISAIKPVFPVENEQFFKAWGLEVLGAPEALHAQGLTDKFSNTVTLTLEKDGKTFDQTFSEVDVTRFPGSYGLITENGDWLDARDNSTNPHYLKNLDRIYYYEYLAEEKTVYVRHSQIQDDPSEDIPTFYDRLFKFVEDNEVEKLVLDVRLNGGGNNYKNKPIVTGIIETEKINQVGKLFVIIGRRTFSACQNLVNELDNYTKAIFVGEPTAENINFYGDNRRVALPNSKIPAFLSFAWWQDKPQWENDDWLAPHFAVDMTFEEFATNQDPVLEAILNFGEDNFILDPMAYLTNLYQTGQQEKLQSEAVRMVSSPAYQFFDFESEFNQLGYQLLNAGDIETAMAVFGFVVQLFPDSANAYDSFAEGHWRAGQVEKAKELYNKAISMDPDGPIGDNARMMLERIDKGE
ncbi:MAG: hypothetical protein AAF502_09590 [Bacteroidota bacterium]